VAGGVERPVLPQGRRLRAWRWRGRRFRASRLRPRRLSVWRLNFVIHTFTEHTSMGSWYY